MLKHRKRKEKALRKLEASEGNLNRLSDLLSEIRRQLKPLGRQAEVARKAAGIQAELRDAKARLLADEMVQATLALESDLADERAMQQRRVALEDALEQARAMRWRPRSGPPGVPALSSAQETWYSLAALRERIGTTLSIARERMRHAEDEPGELRVGRDPDELDREADSVSAAEQQLSGELAAKGQALIEASAYATEREAARQAEEARLAALVRAASDRREGLARLNGQVELAAQRAAAAEAEIGRLTTAAGGGRTRRPGGPGVHRAGDQGGRSGRGRAGPMPSTSRRSRRSTRSRPSWPTCAARSWPPPRSEPPSPPGWRRCTSGSTARTRRRPCSRPPTRSRGCSAPWPRWSASRRATRRRSPRPSVPRRTRWPWPGWTRQSGRLGHLKAEDLGRAGGCCSEERCRASSRSAAGPRCRHRRGTPSTSSRCPRTSAARAAGAAERWRSSTGCGRPRTWWRRCPDLVAVTRDGDVLSAHFAAGGSSAQPSLIEVQAAIDEAEERLTEAGHRSDRLRFAQSQLEEQQRDARAIVEETLARLHESDAAMAGTGRAARPARFHGPLGLGGERAPRPGDNPRRAGPGLRYLRPG